VHLSDDRYRRLLDGTLPGPEARALALHLAAPCDACEAFLAARPGADHLDGRVDGVLQSLAPPRATPGGSGPARVERAPPAPALPGHA